MTIFTSKIAEKKDDSDVPSPEAVSEYKLLVEDEKAVTDNTLNAASSRSNVGGATAVAVLPPRRRSLLRLCSLVFSLILLIILAIGGIMMCRYFMDTRMRVTCHAFYHENDDLGSNENNAEDMAFLAALEQEHGQFEQEVTIEDMEHERIEVPVIGDTRRATVLHDFNKNITAIIDGEQGYCFIMQLNRTLVVPPRDFWDLLVKLKTGYYIPDVEVVRENYRAITPPIRDLTPLGFSVMRECSAYDTYKLVREGEPIAISKRSAEWCEFTGDKWCLGNAGSHNMLCIGIKGCV